MFMKTLFFVLFLWYLICNKEFLIIKKIEILHAFMLLHTDRLKAQRESATPLLCTNMMHVYVALFLGRSW